MAVAVAAPVVIGLAAEAGCGGDGEGGDEPLEVPPLVEVDSKEAPPVEGVPVAVTAGGDDKEKDTEKDVKVEKGVNPVKWLGLYSSAQSILLVGDGDFSFSLALANAFGSGGNLVPTSLDTYEALRNKYSKAESNVAELKRLGATVFHGVDAKEMKLHPDLKNRRFDRIVFNLPHAGFTGKEDDMHMINSHKMLVWGFFHNACHLVWPLGEVHVTHKTGEPYNRWDLEHLAFESSLAMVDKVPFRKEDYPGYNQKRGDSKRSDEPFDLGACCTFKFRIRNLKKLKQMNRNGSGLIPNLGASNVHPGHWVTDRGTFHPVAPVEALPWHHFPLPTHTGRMLMPPHTYIVDQWQQPSVPLNSDGMVAGPYLHKQESCHPMVSMRGPWLNDLPAQGGIPSPLPMGRIPFPDLLPPQEFHPVAPVEALPWHHFPLPAHTGRMLMPPHTYIVDQWQQPSFPLNSDGVAAGPYLHNQESCHPMVSMPGPWLNDLPAQGGIPPPLPMGRIPFPDLLPPQEQPCYQQRTIPDQLGGDSYFFAREHQMSLQREYDIQRQVIPRGTGLTHNAFLENCHRDRESVERLEFLLRMIALYGRK